MKYTTRNLPLHIALVCATVGLGACNSGPSEGELAARAENERLMSDLQGRDSLIGDMTLSLDAIEQNIQMMDLRSESITGSNKEQELSMGRKEKIVRDLQLMNGLMKESRDRIAQMEKRLSRSSVEAKGLRAKLKELDLALAQRDSMMTMMRQDLVSRDFRIEQITMGLDSVELELAKREAIIEDQTLALNRAWYTMGTSKDLLDKGILTKEGGFIGIGKHTVVSEDASTSSFTTTDIRTLQRIEVHAKKGKLMTDHPSASYELVYKNDELAYVEIRDPVAFWHLSRYAVVAVE